MKNAYHKNVVMEIIRAMSRKEHDPFQPCETDVLRACCIKAIFCSHNAFSLCSNERMSLALD